MRNRYDRSKFLKRLEEFANVSYASQKSGIARATIYRWRKDNPEFKEAMDGALNSGRAHLVDVAELALIDRIKNKDLAAIKFFLTHNSDRYLPVRPAPHPSAGQALVLPAEMRRQIKTLEELEGMSYLEKRKFLLDELRKAGIEVVDLEEDINEEFKDLLGEKPQADK